MKAPFFEPGAVVIIGGGFAGLTTALSLSSFKNSPPIVLLDPCSKFVFLPLLYELLSGEMQSWEVAPSYRTLLAGKGISFMQDSVESIDLLNKTVLTLSGQLINFAQLVISTGSKLETYGIPGVSEYAMKFNRLEDVAKLKQLIKKLNSNCSDKQALFIVGGGASGIELACKSADLLNGHTQVHLVERGDRILPNGKSFNQEQALLALAKRKIKLHLNTKVLEVTAKTLEVLNSSDKELRTKFFTHQGLVWTAGSQPFFPPGMPKNIISRGGVLINETLRVVGMKNVFAIGDVAIDSNKPIVATAQLAMQQAVLVASNIISTRLEEPLKSFDFVDRGEILSLGIGEATITGLGITLSGPIAFQLRRLIYLSKMPSSFLGLRSAGVWLIESGKKFFN